MEWDSWADAANAQGNANVFGIPAGARLHNNGGLGVGTGERPKPSTASSPPPPDPTTQQAVRQLARGERVQKKLEIRDNAHMQGDVISKITVVPEFTRNLKSHASR